MNKKAYCIYLSLDIKNKRHVLLVPRVWEVLRRLRTL